MIGLNLGRALESDRDSFFPLLISIAYSIYLTCGIFAIKQKYRQIAIKTMKMKKEVKNM